MIGWFAHCDSQCREHHRDEPWTLMHGFLLEMGGLKTMTQDLPFQEVAFLPRRLSISVAEINDKSEGDLLTKLVDVLQTTWFIVQVLAR